MGGSRRYGLAVAFVTVVALATVVAGVPGYSISATPAIETPTRNVTFEGQQYTVDAVSRIDADGSITVTTTVPSGAAYDLYLRGPDNQLISTERLTGNSSHTFSYFGPDEAGTYAVTLEDDGDTVAVYPVVIPGYDISVTQPDTVEAGEEATLTATVTERSIERHSSLDEVQVVVGNDDVEAEQTMTRVNDTTYEATVSTAELDPDTYNVYVVVRGNETVRERAEILGVSDTVGLTVTAPSTPTESDDDSGDGGDSDTTTGTPSQTSTESDDEPGGGGDSDTTTDTPSQTSTEPSPTPSPSPTSTVAATDTTATSTDRTTATETGTTQTTAGDTPTDRTTETARTAPTDADNVIEPSNQTRQTTGSSGPGFSFLTVGVATLVALLGRRLSNR